jgi:hypothetical protein
MSRHNRSLDERKSQGQEHRSSGRQRCKKDSKLRLMQRAKYRCHQALVYDVSPGGLGLLLDCKLDAGILVAILLKKDLSEASDILSARVKHATAQPDGRWLIGCSLSRTLSNSEMSKLLISEISAYAVGAAAAP